MQIAQLIYNRKYFISIIIRLKKILSKNKRSKITAPSSNFNDHKLSHFNKLRGRVFNYLIFCRQSIIASINDNRYIYSNILGRS
jgi:hypothetical protein